MYIVRSWPLVAEPPTLLVRGHLKLQRCRRQCLPGKMNVTWMDNYERRRWQSCHRTMEGCVPLFLSYGQMARHICCL